VLADVQAIKKAPGISTKEPEEKVEWSLQSDTMVLDRVAKVNILVVEEKVLL